MMRRLPALFAVLVFLAWVAASGASFASQANSAPERIVLVGDESYAPFEYLDQHGDPRGLFVDYWRLWSEATGVDVDYRLMPWSRALEEVQQGRADAVAAIFYSKTRDERFDFTSSYFTIATHVFLGEGFGSYETVEDLKGKRVGVVAEDLAVEVLLERVPDIQLMTRPTHDALVLAALDGEMDAFVADTQVALQHLRRHQGEKLFRIPSEALYVSRVHAAVREGDQATLALLDRGMGQVPHEELELLVAERLGFDAGTGFPWFLLAWAGAGVVAVLALAGLWNRALRNKVRRTVAALEKSESKFREVFDNSYQFMALLDREGRVQRVNRAVLQRLPYAEDVQGSPFWDIPGWRENPQTHGRLRQAVAAAARGELVHFEEKGVDPLGELYLDISLKPLHNEKGEVELLIAEGRDLTARVQAEQELQHWRDTLQERVEERTSELSEALTVLREQNEELERTEEALRSSEEKYRLLVENAGEGIVVLQGKTLRYCNPKIEEFSGYPASELVGQPFLELIHPEDRAMVATNYQNRLNGKQAPEKYDFRIIDKEGNVRWMEITAVRFRWEGAPATLNLLNDVSERKESEQAMLQAKRMAEDASRIMSDFVSMVSHELRTPMTSVLGFAKLILKDFQRWFGKEAIKDPQLAKRARRIEENLRIIIDESDRLSMLINDVLDLAKLESDKYDWHFEDSDIELVIEQALNAVAPLFMDTPVETASCLDKGLPLVSCDRKSIVQVLVNLLANAAKFTDQGQVTVSAQRQDNEILVSVCDTGPGIPEHEQQRIFERFRQSGELLTDKPRGTGLGLSICKEIVEHHGGRIWAESTPGQGSCFRFTLPLMEEGVIQEAMLRG